LLKCLLPNNDEHTILGTGRAQNVKSLVLSGDVGEILHVVFTGRVAVDTQNILRLITGGN